MANAGLLNKILDQNFGPNDSTIVSALRQPAWRSAEELGRWLQQQVQSGMGVPMPSGDEGDIYAYAPLDPGRQEAALNIAGLLTTGGMPAAPKSSGGILGTATKPEFQHSWESIPGANSGHLPQLAGASTPEQFAFHKQVKNVLLDPAGNDRLIAAMGGKSGPAFDAPGVFNGQISPGTQSVSGAQFNDLPMSWDSSLKSREAVEAIRALMLGQDAYAGHMPMFPASASKADMAMLKNGGVTGPDEIRRLMASLDPVLGEGSYATVPSRQGVNILDFGNRNFGKAMQSAQKQIRGAMGPQTETGLMTSSRLYGELPWGEGGATKTVMDILNDQANPGLRQAADSPAMRGVAGDVAGLYDRMKDKGIMPNEKLVGVLRAWAQGGLPAVEELVKTGLAPMAIYGILSTESENN